MSKKIGITISDRADFNLKKKQDELSEKLNRGLNQDDVLNLMLEELYAEEEK